MIRHKDVYSFYWKKGFWMNREFIFKVLFGIGLLFVLFLWSGGIYTYPPYPSYYRYNKITGNTEILNSHDSSSWVNISENR
jgi:hypothetical protein